MKAVFWRESGRWVGNTLEEDHVSSGKSLDEVKENLDKVIKSQHSINNEFGINNVYPVPKFVSRIFKSGQEIDPYGELDECRVSSLDEEAVQEYASEFNIPYNWMKRILLNEEPVCFGMKDIQEEFAQELKHTDGYLPFDGWVKLIVPILMEIRKKYPEIKVRTIKEKFGGLRIYAETPDGNYYDDSGRYKDLYQMIDKAQDESWSICEFHGDKGEKKTFRGWVKTSCQQAYDEAEKKGSWLSLTENGE